MSLAVEVNNLCFRYADGKEALRGVSFAVEEGECVGLIGPNGAGKSTVLLHLNGILPDRSGTANQVIICGTPVSASTLPDIRRMVGLLFQDPDDQLFCPTVFEDVAFGPQQFGHEGEELRSLVRECLGEVGLKGFEQRSPHHLSGGEKQRVCLAGILACRPRILVLDEPTGNLDPRGKRELVILLRSLGVTKVMASHDLEMVLELCRRVIVIDDGRIVADGPSVEVLSNEPLMLAHGLEKPHSLKHRHPHD